MSEAISEPGIFRMMSTKIIVAYWYVLSSVIIPMTVYYDEMTFVFDSREG